MSQAGAPSPTPSRQERSAPRRAFFLRAEPVAVPRRRRRGSRSGRSSAPEARRLVCRAAPRRAAAISWASLLLTKHKEENFANIARAWSLLAAGGTLVCAGANDDGAASLEKHVGKAFGLAGSLSKFHCRVFWLTRPTGTPPDYWRGLASLQPVGDGSWLSQPGIFWWDRVDDGSALLAEHLPGDLDGHVADFGCGWGYLGARAAGARAGITAIDLIDAEHRAHRSGQRQHRRSARLVPLARSRHRGRARDLRRDRLQSALPQRPRRHAARWARHVIVGRRTRTEARRTLVIVANRGLPYEPTLTASFASFETLADNNKFRVSRAVR